MHVYRHFCSTLVGFFLKANCVCALLRPHSYVWMPGEIQIIREDTFFFENIGISAEQLSLVLGERGPVRSIKSSVPSAPYWRLRADRLRINCVVYSPVPNFNLKASISATTTINSKSSRHVKTATIQVSHPVPVCMNVCMYVRTYDVIVWTKLRVTITNTEMVRELSDVAYISRSVAYWYSTSE